MSEVLDKSQELDLSHFRKHFGSNEITPGEYRIIQAIEELRADIVAAVNTEEEEPEPGPDALTLGGEPLTLGGEQLTLD